MNANNNSSRLNIYTIIVLLLFVGLFTRLWYLQIIQGNEFWVKSEENRIRSLRLKAPRGVITDSKGLVLVRNRPSFNVFIIPEDIQDLKKTVAKLNELLAKEQVPISEEQIADKVKKSKRPKFKPTLIYRDISLKTVAYLEEHKMELPGVMVEVEPLRYDIYESVASHIIGYLGEISEDQLKDKKNCPDCEQGDLSGQYGLEKFFNASLSGKPGEKKIEVNAHGRELKTIEQQNPVPGYNLTLTLNLKLQLLAEEALGDKSGALVALDPKNGHILAMVSRPAFNPNIFAGGVSTEEWKKLTKNPDHPLQNKVIQSHYAPGSTFKIALGSAVLQKKVVSANETLYCAGTLQTANTLKHCMKVSGHGYVNIKQAIEQSCNIFFYRAGLELGIDDLALYAKSFGFGEKTGIELLNEDPGLIPTRQWKQETIGDRWYPSETMDAAIGQGFVSITPLQLASAVAAVANGGTLYKPMLVKQMTKANGEVVQEYPPTVIRKLPVDDNYLKIIREGMWMVVNGDHGTGRGSKIVGFEYAGKTGTAQVARMKQRGGQESLPEQLRDHGWFVCYAPYNNPEIVIAIIVEHGIGGARSAAPIAKFMLERLYKPQDSLAQKPKEISPGT